MTKTTIKPVLKTKKVAKDALVAFRFESEKLKLLEAQGIDIVATLRVVLEDMVKQVKGS